MGDGAWCCNMSTLVVYFVFHCYLLIFHLSDFYENWYFLSLVCVLFYELSVRSKLVGLLLLGDSLVVFPLQRGLSLFISEISKQPPMWKVNFGVPRCTFCVCKNLNPGIFHGATTMKIPCMMMMCFALLTACYLGDALRVYRHSCWPGQHSIMTNRSFKCVKPTPNWVTAV